MMSSNQRPKVAGPKSGFDFGDFDPRETNRAWNRFLANRNAPSLPMTGVRSVIYQSWLRSNTGGVKPEQFAAPVLEHAPPQNKSSHDNAELRRATLASLTQIGALLSGAEAMLILTDRNGLILDTVGDTSTLSKASKINLAVGGVWSENAAGTNGIGTALFTGSPVYVHGDEHFCEGMKAWSCAAAPIRDPIDHSIIGIINLSGLTSIFQKHNAAFAATAARDIEVAMAQEQSLLNMRLMEKIVGSYPSRALGPSEGLAIIDRFGRLIFNRNCDETVHKSGRDLGLGARFLDLPEGLTENNILEALPAGHGCQDIQLINIDGNIKGAALVFQQAGPTRSRAKPAVSPQVLDMPGVIIPETNLKIVGKSDAILAALDIAERIATSDTSILIEGQTGVGKQLFARLIHARLSPDLPRGFETINCGAMTEPMFRDRLNSHSADDRPDGLLCLDEIGELHADNQPLLLRYLEERLTRLTGPGQSEPSLAILSLTNRNLQAEVEAGRFRRDLFYRLSSIVLTIPPLKDRGDDVLLIAEHYNRKIAQDTGRDLLIFGDDVLGAFLSHSWPGNVRELRNVISNLYFLAKSRQVTLSDLPRAVVAPPLTLLDPALTSPHAQLVAGSESLKYAEVLLIENALAHHRGNLSSTAKALGISRPTLYRKLHAYGIGAAPMKSKHG